MAKKPRTEKQLAADRRRSREMKGKKPAFLRKRRSGGGRRKSRKSKPQRRRNSVASKRRSGGRRKGIAITPKKALQGAVGIHGAIQVGQVMYNSYNADKDILHATTGVVLRPGQKPSYDKNWLKAVAPGAIETMIGPKLVGKAVGFVSKAVPGGSKIANKRIVTI